MYIYKFTKMYQNTDKHLCNSSSSAFPTVLIHLIVNTNGKLNTVASLSKNFLLYINTKFNNPFTDHIYSSLSGFRCYSKLGFPPIV